MSFPSLRGPTRAPLSPIELIVLVAAVTGVNALAIDIMLPALGMMAADLGAAGDNDRQLVIIVYIVANGVAQLVMGPLADRFGRRPVLLCALAGFVFAGLVSLVAASFSGMIAARIAQGIAAAAGRVAATAVVRDTVAGRRMAEVMSVAMTVFMAVPLLAPAIGQMVLLVAPWRALFVVLVVAAAVLLVWIFVRLPETLAPEARAKLEMGAILGTYRKVVSNRTTLGYTLAASVHFGGLFAYLAMSEQVFVEHFAAGAAFPLAFAAVAGAIAVGTLTNARFVGRVGMRRLAHVALLAFVGINLAHFAAGLVVAPNLWSFTAFTAAAFVFMGFVGPNTNAIAMEPMGPIAGVASAFVGFCTTAISAALGGLIGRSYGGDPMLVPVALASCAFAALVIVWITERGRLFHAGPPADPRPDPTGSEPISPLLSTLSKEPDRIVRR